MKHIPLLFVTVAMCCILNSCKKDEVLAPQKPFSPAVSAERIYTGFPETFESGSKTAYAQANVTLSTGSWNLNDALIGTSTSDHKNATKAVRIENTGMITMNFDATNGA